MVSLVAVLLAAAPLDPAGCPTCHEAIAKQWAGSAHARSGTDPIYRANFALEPMQWCEGCHAPAPDKAIGCATCHVRGGEVLGAKPPTPAALEAHPVRRFTTDPCASCHQFNFPTDRSRGAVKLGPHPMQNTLEEWKATGDGRSCSTCHDHASAGAFDLPTLRRSLSVDVAAKDGVVEAVLSVRDVPHRVPTGDPFHRLRFELCADPDCARVTASRELGRTVVTASAGWFIGRDETLKPGTPTRLEFPSPGAARWRLLYLYAAPSVEPMLAPAQRQLEVYGGPLR